MQPMEFNDRRPTPFEQSNIDGHVKRARASITALGKLDGGTKATFRAMTRHHNTIAEAQDHLMQAGRHDLVGALTEEQKLMDRMSDARRKGQERPELQDRLKTLRKQYRA